LRSGRCLPFGPTTSSTSASISSCRTPSPTPTLSASNPSFAVPASSPSASNTDSGSPSMLCSFAATDAADTVLMRLVLLSSWTWFRTHHGPNATGRGGRTAASSSTSYGTTSEGPLERPRDVAVVLAEGQQPLGELVEGAEVVGSQRFALGDREEQFGLVEPGGVDGGGDERRAGPAVLHACDRGFAGVRAAVGDDPEHAPGRRVGLAGH